MMVLESSAAGGDGDGEGDVEGDDGALAAAFGANTLQSSQHCFEAHQGLWGCLFFVVVAVDFCVWRRSPRSIYTNSRSTAPGGTILI